ncbi:SCO6745 family protein [Ktedonospora formicarum]|nr:hypothetical protein [Ktedonospora formicarum]
MNDQSQLSFARTAWSTLEPCHALIYFAPEARQAYTQAGLKGYWMGYFASRSAPLGAVPVEVVTATFYNFHPRMIGRALPDAWSFSTPERVIQVRLSAADAALRRLLGERMGSQEVAEAAELAREATRGCSVVGRALYATYAALPWPQESHLVLWHAATLLREFRGDGHVAALLGEGIDGCEAHVLQVGMGNVTKEVILPSRGWNEEEWQAAIQSMQRKGLLDNEGQITVSGKTLHSEIEKRTDFLALPPWQHLGEERSKRLLELVRPLSISIIEQGGIPMPNPMGLPRP